MVFEREGILRQGNTNWLRELIARIYLRSLRFKSILKSTNKKSLPTHAILAQRKEAVFSARL